MSTALVTGASSGIGAAFARELAIEGYDLVLVARDKMRLTEMKQMLVEAGAETVELMAIDLTNSEQRETVCERLRDERRPIDLLVNNAGMALGKEFTDASEAEILGQLELNVTAVMLLTHAVIPGMKKRWHGGIINIASIAGMLPGRGSTYSASKAWVTSFSEGVAMSLRGTGVRVVAVCPGFVRTHFHERAAIDMRRTPGALYVKMDTIVAESLEALKSGRPIVIPGRLYKGVAAAAKLAPRSMVRRVANIIERDKRD